MLASVIRRRWRWLLVVAVCAALVIALRASLEYVGSFPGDRWARSHLDAGGLPQRWIDLGFFFAVIGTPTVAGLSLLVSLPFVVRAAGARAAWFVLLACAGILFNQELKELSGPTPLWTATHTEPGLNFPSGHTVYGVVFFGALARLAWLQRRRDIAVVLAGIVLLMGPFRIVADTHLVSDVIAGYLVGAGWLITAALLTGYLPDWPARVRGTDDAAY